MIHHHSNSGDAAGDGYDGTITALIAVGVVALIAFISFAFLGNVMSRIKDPALGILLRVGGLLLATIGCQMMMIGLKAFWLA